MIGAIISRAAAIFGRSNTTIQPSNKHPAVDAAFERGRRAGLYEAGELAGKMARRAQMEVEATARAALDLSRPTAQTRLKLRRLSTHREPWDAR